VQASSIPLSAIYERVVAAFAALARRFGEPVAVVGAMTVNDASADPELIIGWVVDEALEPCPRPDPMRTSPVLPIIDVERVVGPSGEPLSDLDESQRVGLMRELGWLPRVVRGPDLDRALREGLTWARHEIRVIQATARAGVFLARPSWPALIVDAT
jgi:hypothetical protein